jgi:hypothetical protein
VWALRDGDEGLHLRVPAPATRVASRPAW